AYRTEQKAGVRVAPCSVIWGTRIGHTGYGISERKQARGASEKVTVDAVTVDLKPELHGVLSMNPRKVFDERIPQVVPVFVISPVDLCRGNRAAAEADLREGPHIGRNTGNS